MKKITKTVYSSGQTVLVTVTFVVALATLLVLGTGRAVFDETRIVGDITRSRDAYHFAEGAIEDVALRLKKGFTLSAVAEVPIASSTVEVAVTDYPGSKLLYARGVSGLDERRVQATVVANTGIAFNYGLQVGTSGATLSNNAVVNGNIFTNGSLSGGNGSRVDGSVFAAGTISTPNPAVSGQKQSGVAPIGMPVVDIEYWKNAANANNSPYNGNLSFSGTTGVLGPRKVVGNLTVTNNAALTIQGPLHVTGNLVVDNNGVLKLDNSFGSQSTVIIVDGTIDVQNNGIVSATSATPKGYLLLVSLSALGNAIHLDNNGGAQAYFYAYNGTIQLDNNATAMALIGKGISLSNNAIVNYEEGLAHPQFTTGPGGSFDVRGWRETQ